jgi:hypothetical protein
MGPLRVTDPKYELYDQEIWSFALFFLQTGIFFVKPKAKPFGF